MPERLLFLQMQIYPKGILGEGGMRMAFPQATRVSQAPAGRPEMMVGAGAKDCLW